MFHLRINYISKWKYFVPTKKELRQIIKFVMSLIVIFHVTAECILFAEVFK